MVPHPSTLREAQHLEEDVGLIRPTDVAIIELRGDDARSWLNGQLTNDVRATHPGETLYSLFVNVKGRIMADAWVCDAGDDRFYLLVPSATVDRLLESFDGQIIMEDVEPEVRADLAVISLVGPRARELTARAKELGEIFPVDRLGRGGLDVIVPRDRADDAERALGTSVEDADGAAISSDGFELARVRAGRPRFGVDFDDRNYPQETGLEPRAVSFNKGCYLGQEVICMLENRGKLTKRLVSLELSGDAAPDAPIENAGAEIGRVTTVGHDAGKTLAFGYVKRALATPGQELNVGPVHAKVLAVIGAEG